MLTSAIALRIALSKHTPPVVVYDSRLPIQMETCDSLSSIPRYLNDPEPSLWFPETGKNENIASSWVLWCSPRELCRYSPSCAATLVKAKHEGGCCTESFARLGPKGRDGGAGSGGRQHGGVQLTVLPRGAHSCHRVPK